jgi:hypothetical protein
MQEYIRKYLSQFNLDIRKHNDARFMDQKCTPDVVCFIADCVVNTILDDSCFTAKDIWESPYFVKNARAIFNKPWATDETAKREYDKFIQQPLRMLGYAHVLKRTNNGRSNEYRILDQEILEYVAQRERNTFNFMRVYLEKTLKDSGLWKCFDAFIKSGKEKIVTEIDYIELRNRYIRFIIGHTKITKETEVRRIFPKILNVFAVEYNVRGSKKGALSKHSFTFSELMYNNKNWRDLNKEKSVSRQKAKTEENIQQQAAYNDYYMQKAKSLLRKIQKGSEVHDKWSDGPATQVHHIFPKSQFPQIAHYIENLILLTATQHFSKAHPDNNTQVINKDYQLTLLLAKSDTIEESISKVGDKYYRKESFIYVINTGLSEELSTSLSFDDIKQALIRIYNAA